MDYNLDTLAPLGIDIDTGLDYTRAEDKYISALQRYYKAYDKNSSQAEDFYSAKDWDNYTIIVHSLKSNSKMIGALSLSTEFEKLEMASRNGETSIIESNHSSTMSMYKKVIEGLKPIGEMSAVKPADEIDADEARKVANELLEALDDFDDELSAELARKLSGYPFRITQRDKLSDATKLIYDFMYDDAAEIIKEIIPGIE